MVSEAIRVMEAFALGSALDSVKSLPGPLQLVPLNLGLKGAEEARMAELREQVLGVWGLLQSSDGFDPATLMPLVEVGGWGGGRDGDAKALLFLSFFFSLSITISISISLPIPISIFFPHPFLTLLFYYLGAAGLEAASGVRYGGEHSRRGASTISCETTVVSLATVFEWAVGERIKYPLRLYAVGKVWHMRDNRG